jgi:hypothetical protein
MTCHAIPERADPRTMRCIPCRLAWDVADPDPPRCRQAGREIAADGVARPHDCGKSELTRDGMKSKTRRYQRRAS